MGTSSTMDLYAVMGNPINHSKSPVIHTQFAELTKQDLIYSAMLVPKDGFDSAVSDFFKGSGRGLNITVPFKEEAFAYVDAMSERAQIAKAVNTLILQEDGSVLGENTDGAGLVRDLTVNLNVHLIGRRVLILGAGGAVRGVLKPILDEQPQSITIANRTFEKAEALASEFSQYGDVTAQKFEDVAGEFDVIINGTSASLQGDLPPISNDVIGTKTQVYDMMYGKEPTPFMAWATEQGAAQAFDGLGMLVEQAAESFFLWRGVRPDSRKSPAMLGFFCFFFLCDGLD